MPDGTHIDAGHRVSCGACGSERWEMFQGRKGLVLMCPQCRQAARWSGLNLLLLECDWFDASALLDLPSVS